MSHTDSVVSNAREWPAEGLEFLGICPVCGQPGRELLLADLRDRLFGTAPGSWTLWRCSDCDNGYLDPRPDHRTIGQAYASYYTWEYHRFAGNVSRRRLNRLARRNAYINIRWGFALNPAAATTIPLNTTQKLQADRLVRSLPAARAGERLLDIGCGNGAWLDLMRSGGCDVYGVEPDQVAASQARALGLTVEPDLLAAPWPALYFDAITQNHVIEHLHDPRAILLRCHELLTIPEGFAHGIVVMSKTAEFLYKSTDYYAPAHERCILWNDATLAIQWPAGIAPLLSAKDAQGKPFAQAEVFA